MATLDPTDGHSLPLASETTPKLLVSVRSEQELHDALATGVDVLDFKEPRHGPLAPAPPELWNLAASMFERRATPNPILSAALGESETAARVARLLPASFGFAKAGPSQCDSERRLERLWSDVRSQLNRATELVAVAYADHDLAGCLPPAKIFQIAADCGIGYCLLDTFCKNGQSTVDKLGIEGLRDLQFIVQQRNLWWALAGSLRACVAAEVYQQGIVPNCFGVRGDVCEGDRAGRLSSERIAVWRSTMALTQPIPDP